MTSTFRGLTAACTLVSTLALALPAVALAQDKPKAAAAAAKGQTYQVEFLFENGSYLGTMTLQIAKKGAIAGTMAIDRPTGVTGEVAGSLTGDALALDYPFTMVEDGCTGRVVVNATMTKKRDAAEGKATASGCGDTPLEGTFTLKKAPAATAK